jgi:hypothetical protein
MGRVGAWKTSFGWNGEIDDWLYGRILSKDSLHTAIISPKTLLNER